MLYNKKHFNSAKEAFDNIAGPLLLELGFKKSKRLYYRIVNQNILQCVTLEKRKADYDIIFDAFPLYSEYDSLGMGIKAIEIPKLNLCCACDSIAEQISYFCSDIIPAFQRASTDESLYAFRKEWIQIEKAQEYDDCDEEEDELEKAICNIVYEKYAFSKSGTDWLDPDTIYVALKCKDYDAALEEILDRYYYRCASEVLEYQKGEISSSELEVKLERTHNLFRQWLIIKDYIEQGKYHEIEDILNCNQERNLTCLKKIITL